MAIQLFAFVFLKQVGRHHQNGSPQRDQHLMVGAAEQWFIAECLTQVGSNGYAAVQSIGFVDDFALNNGRERHVSPADADDEPLLSVAVGDRLRIVHYVRILSAHSMQSTTTTSARMILVF